MSTRLCTKCKTEKPLDIDHFYVDKKQGFKRWCKKCHNYCVSARSKLNKDQRNKMKRIRRERPDVKAKEKVYAQKRASTPEFRTKANGWQRSWRLENTIKWLAAVAKARAKKRGLAFDEDLTDLSIPSHCPILGIPIVKGQVKSGPHSPSLDKIIPHLGYVKGNRWFISNRANAMKSDATLEEMVLLGKWAQGEIDSRG